MTAAPGGHSTALMAARWELVAMLELAAMLELVALLERVHPKTGIDISSLWTELFVEMVLPFSALTTPNFQSQGA